MLSDIRLDVPDRNNLGPVNICRCGLRGLSKSSTARAARLRSPVENSTSNESARQSHPSILRLLAVSSLRFGSFMAIASVPTAATPPDFAVSCSAKGRTEAFTGSCNCPASQSKRRTPRGWRLSDRCGPTGVVPGSGRAPSRHSTVYPSSSRESLGNMPRPRAPPGA